MWIHRYDKALDPLLLINDDDNNNNNINNTVKSAKNSYTMQCGVNFMTI